MADRLWAPWRLAYITGRATPPPYGPQVEERPRAAGGTTPAGGPECFLCRAADHSSHDRENLVAYRTELSVVVLNRFPYNNGHLLVSPRAHKATLGDLTSDELLDLQLVMRKFIAIMEKRLNADGFNVGLNLGRAAGAGVPGHLHWHIVPRWNGDQNFMAVTGDTSVISQSLEALYDLLLEELARG